MSTPKKPTAPPAPAPKRVRKPRTADGQPSKLLTHHPVTGKAFKRPVSEATLATLDKHRRPRPKGVPNKNTRLLKEAILKAAEQAGNTARTGPGKGGLTKYLKFLAIEHPSSFATLLGRVLPMQVASDPDNPVGAVYLLPEDYRLG